MDSLKDVYNAMAQKDHVKVAQAQPGRRGPDFSAADKAMLKQAQDYDHIGRVMAHQAFADLVKEAMDEAMPDASEEEKKKEVGKLLAKANGEESDSEDSEEDFKDDSEKKAEADMEGMTEEEKKAYLAKMKKEEEGTEKKAAAKARILDRMSRDPQYVSHLLSKYDLQ